MAHRNFDVYANIDGRQTALYGAPRALDGGMYVKVGMRVNGESVDAILLSCVHDSRTDELVLTLDIGRHVADYQVEPVLTWGDPVIIRTPR